MSSKTFQAFKSAIAVGMVAAMAAGVGFALKPAFSTQERVHPRGAQAESLFESRDVVARIRTDSRETHRQRSTG